MAITGLEAGLIGGTALAGLGGSYLASKDADKAIDAQQDAAKAQLAFLEEMQRQARLDALGLRPAAFCRRGGRRAS